MALNARCPEGHNYISADIYRDWPEGAPHCPICFAAWSWKKMVTITAVDYRIETGHVVVFFDIGDFPSRGEYDIGDLPLRTREGLQTLALLMQEVVADELPV